MISAFPGKLSIKSYLMMLVESFIKAKGMTQDQASFLKQKRGLVLIVSFFQ
nr:hypothetical protein [uncultured Desulfobacter sp.]